MRAIWVGKGCWKRQQVEGRIEEGQSLADILSQDDMRQSQIKEVLT